MISKAQDWTQWHGHNLEGVVKTTGLNLNWEEKKPNFSSHFFEQKVLIKIIKTKKLIYVSKNHYFCRKIETK